AVRVRRTSGRIDRGALRRVLALVLAVRDAVGVGVTRLAAERPGETAAEDEGVRLLLEMVVALRPEHVARLGADRQAVGHPEVESRADVEPAGVVAAAVLDLDASGRAADEQERSAPQSLERRE